MKAAVHSRYGKPEVVEIKDIQRPSPADDEILIKVHAAAVNDFDWGLISGKPYFIRLFLGLFRPKIQISGCDIAGCVTEVGRNVRRWRIGDEVYGDLSGGRFGGFAEYVCCREDQVARKPTRLNFVEAAGIPQAAVLAWQALTAGGAVQDGQRVLINGAGGGVGTFGLQLARQKQVDITGVDSADKLEMMRSLGFHHLVDYRKTDFTGTGDRYDLIVDTKTNRWPAAYLRALEPGGTYATVGGESLKLLLIALLGPLFFRLTGKTLKVITLKPNLNLDYFSKLADSGNFRTVVDGIHPLDDFVEVMKYYLKARQQGKIIFQIDGRVPVNNMPASETH